MVPGFYSMIVVVFIINRVKNEKELVKSAQNASILMDLTHADQNELDKREVEREDERRWSTHPGGKSNLDLLVELP